MEEKEIIVRTEEHNIKPFKHIRIGDPMYFEALASGDDPKTYKDIVADIKTSCCNVGSIRIEEKKIEMEKFDFTQIDVEVLLAKDEEQLEVYKTGRWYGEKSMKKAYTLGCDTASFEIEVDGRGGVIHTGSDGYFGELREMKQYYGLMLSLSFDGDLFSFEEIVQKMDNLFPRS